MTCLGLRNLKAHYTYTLYVYCLSFPVTLTYRTVTCIASLALGAFFSRHMRDGPRDRDPPDLVTTRAELQETSSPRQPGAPGSDKRAPRCAPWACRDAAQDLPSSLIGASNGHRLSRHAPIDQSNRPGAASNWRGRLCNLGLIQARGKVTFCGASSPLTDGRVALAENRS